MPTSPSFGVVCPELHFVVEGIYSFSFAIAVAYLLSFELFVMHNRTIALWRSWARFRFGILMF